VSRSIRDLEQGVETVWLGPPCSDCVKPQEEVAGLEVHRVAVGREGAILSRA
jgi:hypothetical protein